MGDSCVAKTQDNDVPSTGGPTDTKEAVMGGPGTYQPPQTSDNAHSLPQYSAPQSQADFCNQVKQCFNDGFVDNFSFFKLI